MHHTKHTMDHSEIDSQIRLLTNLDVPFEVKVLGTVRGRGVNDGEYRHYEIRELTYKDKVVREQMIRSDEGDVDDVLVSVEMRTDTVPEYWPLEISDQETNSVGC